MGFQKYYETRFILLKPIICKENVKMKITLNISYDKFQVLFRVNIMFSKVSFFIIYYYIILKNFLKQKFQT